MQDASGAAAKGRNMMLIGEGRPQRQVRRHLAQSRPRLLRLHRQHPRLLRLH